MAQEASGRRFCKVSFNENGRTWNRRYHELTVQAADGRVHRISGSKLPDSMTFYSGVPLRGAHLAEVLMSPEEAKGTPFLPAAEGWISKRDVFYLVLGFFFFELITALAHGVAVALY